MSLIYLRALEAAKNDLDGIPIAHRHSSTIEDRRAAEVRVRYVLAIDALEKLLRHIGRQQQGKR